MNIFQQTTEQARHWKIMKDEKLFGDSRCDSNEKIDKQYEAARISHEVSKRLYYLRKSKKGKFYSLGGTAGTLKSPWSLKENSANDFITEVENVTFDDSELVRILIVMQENLSQESGKKKKEPRLSVLQEASQQFINGKIETQLGFGDSPGKAMTAHANSQIVFLKYLQALKERLIFHKDVLTTHPLFVDIENVILQIDGIYAICRDSKMNSSQDSSFIVAELPDDFRQMFPESCYSMDSKTHNIFIAKSLFLHHLGLVPHIKHFFTLGSLIDYVERAADGDQAIQGVYPVIVDPQEDGLVLDVEGFSHPAIYRGKPIRKHFKDIYDTLGRDTLMSLQNNGLMSFWGDGDENDYRWEQGVTTGAIEKFIRKYKLSEGSAETLMSIYQNSAFFPFKDIHLNTRNRIQIVTGANFNGKSTYMQSIGYLFHRAATARKLIATSAKISLPDMVFDDFDINAQRQRDISRECSTFSSQVNKIVAFMKNATKQSIGLFDELYHGTSAPYLLSLGWATIEEFERIGLYAIISTHEPLLTRYTEKNGYESLRGKYYRPPHSAFSERETSVGNVSLQVGYELKHEPVTDSDAFRIARQENMSESVMARAQSILKHITAKPNA